MQTLWLPFADKLDWDSIALVVHKDNTSEIPDLIARTDITVRPDSVSARFVDNYHIQQVFTRCRILCRACPISLAALSA